MRSKMLMSVAWMVGTLAIAQGASVPAKVQASKGLTMENVRDRLTPQVEQTLQRYCGKDCPGFRIEAKAPGSIASPTLDDLGFGDGPGPVDESVKAANVVV